MRLSILVAFVVLLALFSSLLMTLAQDEDAPPVILTARAGYGTPQPRTPTLSTTEQVQTQQAQPDEPQPPPVLTYEAQFITPTATVNIPLARNFAPQKQTTQAQLNNFLQRARAVFAGYTLETGNYEGSAE